MGLAIVALPEEGDRSYKISSEKVPHCTLLFLGDADSANQLKIAAFLQHAVSIMEIGPFGLEVSHRGTLGDEGADVLFFKKERWSIKRVGEFRAALLKDNSIRDAYDSTEQFPEWTPHLTLGYPGAPAREDPDGFPIRWVEFNRIALWSGNYEGPEFRLEYKERGDVGELAMTQQAELGRSVIEHFGTKGMKWGVRKTVSGAKAVDRGYGKAETVAATVKNNVRDARFVTTKKNTTGTVSKLVAQASAKTAKDDLPRINAKHASTGAKTSKTPWVVGSSKVPAQKAYRKEVQEAYRKNLDAAANATRSPSGKYQYQIKEKVGAKPGATVRWKVKAKRVEHATDDTDFEIEVIESFDGLITGFKLVENSSSMAQAEDFIFGLMHYGTKGMKWGHRKSRNESARAEQFKNAGISGKTKVKAKGGTGQKASEDAVKAAIQKQTLKKSGVAALSNKELQELSQRLNLEKQVTELAASPGKSYVMKTLGQTGKQQVSSVVNQKAAEATQQVLKKR